MFRRFAHSRRSMDSAVHPPDSGGFGPLVDRGLDKLWKYEAGELISNELVHHETRSSDGTSLHIPEALLTWRRPEDKQASEDEPDIVRLGSNATVRDAKLFKVKCDGDKFVAIYTASSLTLIQIAEANRECVDSEFWEQILSRAEYLSSSLSVKKIRLLLDALANSPPGIVDEGRMKEFVHTLGVELLHRYHSMTPFTCASVAASLAKLKCRDMGTLNLLALAFEQNVSEPQEDLEPQLMHKYAIQIRDSFSQLEYAVPVLEETVEKVLKNAALLDETLVIH